MFMFLLLVYILIGLIVGVQKPAENYPFSDSTWFLTSIVLWPVWILGYLKR